jgi:hypothetical protein
MRPRLPQDTPADPFLTGKSPPLNVQLKQRWCSEFQQSMGHAQAVVHRAISQKCLLEAGD